MRDATVQVGGRESRIATLHPRQQSVFKSASRFKVVVAGRRWGKTWVSIQKIIKMSGKPRSLVWYVAPTYSMARDIVWEDLKEAIPRSWIVKINESRLSIKLINGSLIVLKGADRPDTLRGVGLTYVILDEYQDMRKEVWSSALRPTLATTRGGALFIGTPKSFNHFYDLYKRGQSPALRRANEWTSWQFATADSPFVPRSEIEQARRDLDPKTFRQEFEASFESMSGQVYYPFDRDVHVGKYPFNSDLPIWIGQDFNIDPMSSAVMQPQKNGDLWVVDELVIFNSNVSEVCDELERRYWRHTKRTRIYPDPAGASRGHARGESALDIFRQRGFRDIVFRKKHPLVQDRINAVNGLLMSADGTIRMRVNEGCRNVIDGFEQTIYKAGSPEVDKSLGKEHVIDGIGYCAEREYPTRRVIVMGAKI